MTTESFKMFITGPLSALPYSWVTVIPVLLFAGGAGHLGAWAGVCQRVTDGAELLPANPPSQWQVSAMTTSCNGSISGETQQFWRLNTRMTWLYCWGGEKNHMMHFCSGFAQAEQHRQRHPLWKPGGDPHLPAGTVCGIGGVYQVRHMRHKWHVRTPSLWSRAVLGPIGSILLVGAEDKCDIFSSIYAHAKCANVLPRNTAEYF